MGKYKLKRSQLAWLRGFEGWVFARITHIHSPTQERGIDGRIGGLDKVRLSWDYRQFGTPAGRISWRGQAEIDIERSS